MVVQICCSVDSFYFLRRLKNETKEPIIGYFYDPNIHPYSEFLLRFLDAKRDCKKLGIKLFLGEYDYESWLNGSAGLENEPEKGKRCEFCFDFRMDKTAEFAKNLGEKKITTTLLMSPKKSHSQLVSSLEKICKKYDLEFIAPDFRKNGGTNEQFALAKQNNLYHQNYCGCFFALQKQRAEGEIFELMSDIKGRVLPNSIEAKISLYKKIIKLEKNGEKFEIFRDKFINYRLLNCFVKFDDKPVKSYILWNSHFKRKFIKFQIPQNCEKFFSDKDEVKIFSLKEFAKISGLKISNIDEILNTPLKISKELKIRAKITEISSFSPIIIVENLPACKVEISSFSNIYLDIREILVRI